MEIQNHTPNEEHKADARQGYVLGFQVFAALMVLTILEYFIGKGFLGGSLMILAIIALAKAGLIIQFFMHIYRLWSDEEGH